jgi:hypothetical protein
MMLEDRSFHKGYLAETNLFVLLAGLLKMA